MREVDSGNKGNKLSISEETYKHTEEKGKRVRLFASEEN